MTGLAILIPAAGRAARMQGRDKLLETVGGQPLIRRQAGLALALGGAARVTLPADRPARAAALEGLDEVETAILDNAHEGLSASLRHGATWAQSIGAKGMMVVLADLPDLSEDDLRKMAQIFENAPETVIRATDQDNRPGHPVILPARLFTAMQALTGDTGAQPILKSETILPVPLPGHHATTDLDTPEDWAAWRAQAEKPAP